MMTGSVRIFYSVLTVVALYGAIVGWISIWVPILIFLGIPAILAVSTLKDQAKSMSEQVKIFKTRCEKESLTYKPDFSIEDPRAKMDPRESKAFLLGVSEEKSQILIGIMDGNGEMVESWLICIGDVLSVELSLNNNSVYQAGPIASLAATAAGGLTFGGAGTIVGSLTTGRVGAGKISELALNLRMDSIDEPLTKIHFISEPVKSSVAQAELQLAEKWTNLIEVMRHRLANSDKSNT